MRKLALYGALVLLSLVGWLILLVSAGALSTITVTTTSDVIASDGLCSLREAVIAANTDAAFSDCPGGSGEDVIEFDPSLPVPAIFALTNTGANEDSALTGDLDISGILSINGAGMDNTILDGLGADRVFEILPAANATITGIRIRNGDPGTGADGGGIAIDLTGRLTLNDSTVISNTATLGGGINVLGLLSSSNSSVTGNQGGGISNDAGLLLLSNVHVTNNSGGYGISSQNGAQMVYSGGTVSGNQGGGIYNATSTATLTDLTVNDNSGGPGVHNQGTTATNLTLANSAVMSNTATSGAGILNEGLAADATIDDTRISLNIATAGGGGVNNSGIMTIRRSTIDHNQARTGGAIDHAGSSLQLTNDTLSNNSVSDNGGGLYNRTAAALLNVTFTTNSASGPETGGNIFVDGDTASLSVHNTIVANAGAGGNCFNNLGTITSLGHNLESTNTCGFGATGDITNTNPLLGPLQDNGGPTWTHALLAGSPAINAGDNNGCPTTDQRGVARPQGTSCDIGSYERIFGGEADLTVSKVDAVDPVTVGDNISYTVNVSNSGPDTASNVVLVDDLPGGVAFVSATPGQGSCSQAGGVITCNLGNMADGENVGVEIVVSTTTAGILTNQASASADTTDPNPANNSANEDTTVNPTPVPEADLSIAKTDSPDPVDAGETLTYTLAVTNAGPDAATTVTVIDQLPVGVTFGSATGAGWSCSHSGGVVSCDRAVMPVGSAPNIVLTVIAPASGRAITNTAWISSTTIDPDPSNNADSEQTTVAPPGEEVADLSIAKADGPDPVDPGATLVYTLTVSNGGPYTATAITMLDTLPAGVTYQGAAGDGWGCSYVGATVTCQRPGLEPGVAPAIVLSVTAPASSGTFTNVVTVSGRESDPDLGNNVDTTSTLVRPHTAYLPIILLNKP